MSEEQEPNEGQGEGEEVQEVVLPLPPGTPITWEQVAEAMRRSTGALAPAVMENVSQADIETNDVMTAIASGATAWAVDAYFRYWTALGMSPGKVRAQMNREINRFWKQSLAHAAAAMRRAH